jgi:hypothetical protein
MAHDYLLLAGSVAFGCAVGDAEIALSRREGLQDVHFVRSGPCTEFPASPIPRKRSTGWIASCRRSRGTSERFIVAWVSLSVDSIDCSLAPKPF